MSTTRKWRVRHGLTQAEAATLLGISQTYLSLIEKGARPLTAAVKGRMNAALPGATADQEDLFRAQLAALGYPAFAHIKPSRTRPRHDALLISVLSQPDTDARVADSLPWLVATFQDLFDYRWLVRQAKLRNLQNRLGFVLEAAGVETREGRAAIEDLRQARLIREDTLCWDSMPLAVRDWMRNNRTPLASHWNILTRVGTEAVADAA